MKVLLSLVAIGWVISTPGVLITICVLALGAMVLCARIFVRYPFGAMSPMTWVRIEPRFDDAHGYTYQPERVRLLYRLEELERDLSEARREVDILRGQNEKLERNVRFAKATMRGDSTNPVYRRVGLHQDAPEWVILAVRRAYRSHLHPDRYSPQLRPEAERRFKEAEQIFVAIWRMRGFTS